ncbi:MAG TPA: 30S ribosomal protein S16 [bacterium]|jgi:small subunit ribosomal protein S16|nr:30S ribosomal protein S16 [bacterium]HNZ51308.1 30S ribosomal protein S16 [bacterium]HOF79489.1 30S ribosomal protein S16 [bacterium]HOH85225.1 30S ribosomal protein S16 [bacterium]HOQ91726.1 30S ribosomal protein S16 [bacterium]
MLKIKLARIGKKKAPFYRFIISEVGRDPYGRILENLGSYNPKSKELQAKAERINYWLSQGAQMTTTVNNLLVSHQIIKGEIIRVVSKQPAPVVAETVKPDKTPTAAAAEPVAAEEVAAESTVEEPAAEVAAESTEEPVEEPVSTESAEAVKASDEAGTDATPNAE